jgi:predicted component of type VI protein secretion system
MVGKLIVASGKSAGRAITLKPGQLLIGRADECHIRPLGDEVSRRHCLLRVEEQRITVEDLKSRNGSYVNGVRIESVVQLADGDLLRVGPLELKVSCAAPAPPAAAPHQDDVSRWLMADDEPAGMYDTTQMVKLEPGFPATPAAPAAPVASAGAAAPAGEGSSVISASAGGDESKAGDPSATVISKSTEGPHVSGIQDLIASRGQAGKIPAELRGPRTNNSKDAAAEALRKFFGKR